MTRHLKKEFLNGFTIFTPSDCRQIVKGLETGIALHSILFNSLSLALSQGERGIEI